MFPPSSHADADAPIRQTDCDASAARLSAVQKQYLSDPFVHFFVPRAQFQQPRPPLINIGTFVRSTAIDELVHQWFSLSQREGKPCQIVSLGAGSDTRFWRIAVGPSRCFRVWVPLTRSFKLDEFTQGPHCVVCRARLS
jgi:[phosphatase 2A protein]-leucine-carboxy methyltransferase